MVKYYFIAALGITYIFSNNASHAQESQNICNVYHSFKEESDSLINRYQNDIRASDSNELRHQALIDADKANLDRVFARRNDAVYKYVHGGQVKNITVMVDKIEVSLEDNGDGAKNYGYINAHIQCDPQIGILIPKIAADSQWGPLTASLNAGDFIEVSGHLIAHDEENQRPADAVQWAGPLWGLFMDLRTEALLDPSLEIAPTEIRQINPRQAD